MATADGQAPAANGEAVDGGYIKVEGAQPEGVDNRSTSYLEAQEQAPLLDDAKAAPAAAAPAAAEKAPSPSDETEGMSKAEYKKFQEQKAKAENVNMTEHKISVEEVARLWQTALTKNGDTWVPFGLTNAEADKRRGETGDGRPVPGAYKAPDPKDPESKGDFLYCGVNRMKPPPKVPEWKKFLKEMAGPFNLLLWAAGILCFIAFGLDSSVPDNVILGSVLFFVVSATGIFSYVQVSQSDKAMEKFKGMVPTECECYREGHVVKIDPAELVVGDIVQLKYGDKVPADVRIFAPDNFKVDNSSLTGESEAQKRSEEEEPEQSRAIEAGNIAFFTTQVPTGTAKGIVIRVGDATVIGKIQTLVTGTKAEQSPINKEIEHFIHLISGIALVLGVTFFIIALSLNPDEWIDAVVFFIGIVVANVPEGLLATVTVCLALCANKMAKKKVLVKNLESVETLGSTSCICSDKTGTLTQNLMTAVHLFYDGGVSRCSATMDLKITGENERDNVDVSEKTFQELWRVAQLCNIAKFVAYPEKGDVPDELKGKCMDLPCQQRATAGDASESAILKFCDRVATEDPMGEALRGEIFGEANPVAMGPLDKVSDIRNGWDAKSLDYRSKNEKLVNIPFNSKEKYAGSIHSTKDFDGQEELLFCLKGAPERIIARCGYVMKNGEAVPLTDAERKTIDTGNASLMRAGERVLGFAMRRLPKGQFERDGCRVLDADGKDTGTRAWGDADMKKGEHADFNGTNYGKPQMQQARDKKGVLMTDESGNPIQEPIPFPYNGLPAMPSEGESKELIFLGLIALIDPPRDAVPKAVKDCMAGGIQVIMVTGDHPITAKAIAKSIQIIRDPCPEDLAEQEGLIDGSKGDDTMKLFLALPQDQQDKFVKARDDEGNFIAKAMVVNGEQLESISEEDLEIILQHDQLVFARTSPEQKLRIVNGCQRLGRIVAVTGDGVNDSPALKAADIGVAMGIAGSPVSKEAADMILLNDDFASIVVGVEEGRIVFDNLKKSIAYTLTSNIPEISPFLLFIIVAVPLPLSTVMILAIDLGTDMYPAISMAYEGPESDIMRRPPRDPVKDNLVTLKLLQYTYLQIGMIQACAGFFCYFVVMSDSGWWPGDLPGLRDDYHDEDIFVTDSYNQEWTSDERLRALSAAQTSYFTSIVIVQWADLIICKTRVLSVFQQGMNNWVMNKAILFETCLAIFITYTPGMDIALKTGPLQGVWWLPALSFSFIIWVYDEGRKYLMRKYRHQHPTDRFDHEIGKVMGPITTCIDLNEAEHNPDAVGYKRGWVENTTYY